MISHWFVAVSRAVYTLYGSYLGLLPLIADTAGLPLEDGNSGGIYDWIKR